MPVLTDDTMEQQTIRGSAYGFSGARVDRLGASEYTLVVIACDVSGSVSPFASELEAALKAAVEACRTSPRADNLLLRVVTFNHRLAEVHGFKPLPECAPAGYDGILRCTGETALFDAAHNGVQSAVQYAKGLHDQDFLANAVVFVITDGLDNVSTFSPSAVKTVVEEAKRAEALESILLVLVGVDVTEPQVQAALERFKTQAQFDQYVDVGAATKSSLAKLAQFVSRSISAQSQSLGSGGPSKPLSF